MQLLNHRNLPKVPHDYYDYWEMYLYESEPYFRTVSNKDGRHYIYFPYVQYIFLKFHKNINQYHFYATSSKFSIKNPNNVFYKIFGIAHFCLGEGSEVTTNTLYSCGRFWNTKFKSHSSFKELADLTKKFGMNAPDHYPRYAYKSSLIRKFLPYMLSKEVKDAPKLNTQKVKSKST